MEFSEADMILKINETKLKTAPWEWSQRVAERRLELRIWQLIDYLSIIDCEIGRTFKMADDQGVNFEPESKRPRICVESTSTVNQSVNEELKTKQAQCESREKLNPEKSAWLTCPVCNNYYRCIKPDKKTKWIEQLQDGGSTTTLLIHESEANTSRLTIYLNVNQC